MAQKQKEKSKKYIKKVKSFSCCKNCGIKFSECLEFHHLNDKNFTISNASNKGIETIKKEMRKCIVLCSNCHRELHFLEKNEEYKNLKLCQIFKKELEKISKIKNSKLCKNCNKEFKGTSENRIYCSSNCFKQYRNLRYFYENKDINQSKTYNKKSKEQLLKEKSIRRKDSKNSIKKYIINLKHKNGCNKCGEKRWFCLDFHHKEDKFKNVSKMLSQVYGLKSIKNEISKCELLCSNCHKKEHSKSNIK